MELYKKGKPFRYIIHLQYPLVPLFIYNYSHLCSLSISEAVLFRDPGPTRNQSGQLVRGYQHSLARGDGG